MAQVTAANQVDHRQLIPLLQGGMKRSSRLRHVWVDKGYRDGFVSLLTRYHHGITLEVVSRPPGVTSWQLLSHRWVVERTFAWLGRFRRMSKDYEYLTQTSEAMIYSIMSFLMLRRLAQAQ